MVVGGGWGTAMALSVASVDNFPRRSPVGVGVLLVLGVLCLSLGAVSAQCCAVLFLEHVLCV